jgi:hypothetical protein
VVDQQDFVSTRASQCDDCTSPIGVSNELLVVRSAAQLNSSTQRDRAAEKEQLENWENQLQQQQPQQYSTPIEGRSRTQSNTSPCLTTRSAETSCTEIGDDEEYFSSSRHPFAIMGQINHASRSDRRAMANAARSLALRNLSLCDDGVQALVTNLHPNGYIRELDLSYNSISDEGIQSLSSAFTSLSALHTLKLNGNGFASDGARYLASGLSHCPSMRILELARNRLGDDGSECIAQFLTYNMSVHTLFLDENFVSDDGLRALSEMLFHNRTLTKLSLSANRFTVSSMEKLSLEMQVLRF